MTLVSTWLVADHERLHALLEKACVHDTFDAEAFSRFRTGLLRHIAIEEKLLLPAARRARGGAPIERAYELRVEHAALTSLLVPTPDIALCTEIATLLASHDGREEGPGGVYEECEHLLMETESAALAEKAAGFPEVPVAPHFDGPHVNRTAASALAAAKRMKQPSRASR